MFDLKGNDRARHLQYSMESQAPGVMYFEIYSLPNNTHPHLFRTTNFSAYF